MRNCLTVTANSVIIFLQHWTSVCNVLRLYVMVLSACRGGMRYRH